MSSSTPWSQQGPHWLLDEGQRILDDAARWPEATDNPVLVALGRAHLMAAQVQAIEGLVWVLQNRVQS